MMGEIKRISPKKAKENAIKKFDFTIYKIKKGRKTNNIELKKIILGEGYLLRNGKIAIHTKQIIEIESDNAIVENIFFIHMSAKEILKDFGYSKKTNINQEYDEQATFITMQKIRNRNLFLRIKMQIDDVVIENIVNKKTRELKKEEFLKVLGLEPKHLRISKKARIFEINNGGFYIIA